MNGTGVYKKTLTFIPMRRCKHFPMIVIEPLRWRYGHSENWHEEPAESEPGTYCLGCGAKLAEMEEVQHA